MDGFSHNELYQTQSSFANIANRGIFDRNPLSCLYFSDKNVNDLHEAIRYSVWKETDKKIDRQSENHLFAIMNSIFKQFGRHGQPDIRTEVRRLNGLVLDFAVPDILKEMKNNERYMREVGRSPIPMARSQNVSIKGTKVLNMGAAYDT
jgi:hypothetical protein